MIFQSFIFRPNPKKIHEDKLSFVYLGAAILALLLLFIFIPGLLPLLLFGGIAGGLVKLKIDDIKSKGVNRFGSLPERFSLSAEKIVIGTQEFPMANISDLKIEADDFKGGPGGDILSSSLGVDNYITFTNGGEKHSYQFLVQQRNDLAVVKQIYNTIPTKK